MVCDTSLNGSDIGLKGNVISEVCSEKSIFIFMKLNIDFGGSSLLDYQCVCVDFRFTIFY